MSRRTIAIAAALSLVVLGSPLIAGCRAQSNVAGEVSNTASDLNSDDILAIKDEVAKLSLSIESNPQDAISYNNSGVTKKKLGDYHGAIADYAKVLEINPQDVDSYYSRGVANMELGDRKNACIDFKKAASLGDKDAAEWVRDQCQ